MTILAAHVERLIAMQTKTKTTAQDLEKTYGDLVLDIKANTLSHEQKEFLIEMAMDQLRCELACMDL